MSEADWEHESGTGLWKDHVNKKTGEHTVKEHKLRTIWKSCVPSKHNFKITANREATCGKCGMIRGFVVGKEKLVDGNFKPI